MMFTPRALRGLGVDTPADFAGVPAPKSTGFPSWCNWMPFADYFDACRVPTPEEQAAETEAAIRKAATATTPVQYAPPGSSTVADQAVGQTNEALVAQQMAAYQQDLAALCRTDPVNCAAYKKATTPDYSTWVLLGAAGFALLLWRR